jgi:predicted nucleic acid-binding protein
MMTKIESVETYQFTATDRLFLDTNIWLPVYAPGLAKTPDQQRIYSDVLKRIKLNHGKVYIDALVLSEFINAWSRFVFRSAGGNKKFGDFKRFRHTADFCAIAPTIASECRKITDYCQRTGSCLETVDINAVFSEFALGRHDFNDQMIREICLANGLTLVTDDGDFSTSGLHILTANQRMLSSATP